MKVVQINGGVFGSTGKIMFSISDIAADSGIDVKCFSPVTSTNRFQEPNHPYTPIGTYRGRQLSVLAARITGLNGCFAFLETKKLLKQIDDFHPDVIQLHTLHDSYINLPMLFSYLKAHNEISVIWTLHDCWAFTGHCTYFTAAKCDKWMTGCESCPQRRTYPRSLVDNSNRMWTLKKRWFAGIEKMTLVTPSKWLADLVRQSYLKNYSVNVIYNGIDLTVFKPTVGDFRDCYGLRGKRVVLGVAFEWGKKKGLDVFAELAHRLDERFQIVLIGTDAKVDKLLPENIISIHRTQDQEELAGIYSAADLFVNPTREEVLGMVNIEALACGTPVLTFNTGGSPECIDDTCGCVVDCDDVDAMEQEIIRITDERPFTPAACVEKAKSFAAERCFGQYVEKILETCE